MNGLQMATALPVTLPGNSADRLAALFDAHYDRLYVFEGERDRVRQAVLAAAADVAGPSSSRFRGPAALAITIAAIVVGIAIAGSAMWLRAGTTLQAAVRFEVRLAEDRPAAGLREARVVGSDRVVYLHEEVVVTNADIESSRVIPGDRPSRFGVGLTFNAAGAEKMRQASYRLPVSGRFAPI